MNELQPECWYALRVSYSRELKLKEILDTHGLENFIPMSYKIIEKDGQRKRIRVPAIHNLVFVHAAYGRLRALHDDPATHPPFYFLYQRGTRNPIVIPDVQMRNFMLDDGFVLGTFYSNVDAPVENSGDVHAVKYGDGTIIKHDRSTGKLTINATGDIDIIAGGKITINGQTIYLN